MINLKFEKPTIVKEETQEGFKARFSITPLERGFGITIGNSLRRILLSSLPGSAVVGVQIEGVPHEFSVIDGVTEDVMGIILNLKKLVIKTTPTFTDGQKLKLNIVGPKTVTAADFNFNPEIEIVNKNLVIATVSEGGHLSLEATIATGHGYVEADENKKHANNVIGVIPIDAIFTPIERVTYRVDKLRDDQDELILDIETNGAIQAKDALSIAAKILVDYLNNIVKISENTDDYEFVSADGVKTPIVNSGDIELDKLNLSSRAINSLRRYGIKTMSELTKKTEEEIEQVQSLGKKSIQEIKEKMQELGYSFRQENHGGKK